MCDVVGVKLEDMPKIYFFHRNRLNIKAGDRVVVETDMGEGIGRVVGDYLSYKPEGISHELKRVLRRANDRDIERERLLKEKQGKAFSLCFQKIKEFGLDMNLVKVQYFFDETKAIFYFTAEGRVDFRELVKDLARSLGTRIEMRQIGVRDKAKLVGGMGSCGRELCCKCFLQDFEPVSVRMAKDQNLTLNPSKISGVCGRLMCCLTFEHGVYKNLGRDLPKCGKKVKLEDGVGKVTRHNLLEGTITVTHEDGREIQFTREGIESLLSEVEE